MASSRRRFTKEFKAEAVNLIVREGKPLSATRRAPTFRAVTVLASGIEIELTPVGQQFWRQFRRRSNGDPLRLWLATVRVVPMPGFIN